MNLKYIDEYRGKDLAADLLHAIRRENRKSLCLMEVCGTHTMAIFRYGIPSLLPDNIRLLSGPGCPVCVTAQKDIDAFVSLASINDIIITTFGDLMRVPGSSSSLASQKAAGADVRIVYSIMDALAIARDNPDREVVFCAVGFETTIPTVAAGILATRAEKVKNFSIYAAHKLTPPALKALLEAKDTNIDGFLLPGHVSVITGIKGYESVFDQYRIPSVIAGFEPNDILRAVHMLVQQNAAGRPRLENAYPRAVSVEGNIRARQVMNQVFTTCDTVWRGIGVVASSGMKLRPAFIEFSASERFNITTEEIPEPKRCACGEILMGIKTPEECPLYKTKCTPLHPVGPCMVSSEGSCAAFYRYT